MSNNSLRIVFMGTPDFAVESLKVLVENNCNIVGVITAPDKPAGRGQKLRKPPVKIYAEEQGIKVLQPEKLKAPDFLEELRSLRADLQVIVAFRMLPEVVWSMPPKGSFNLHASLLPQYRGAAPINWAVINGEKETGATTFFLQHEIDTGNIIFQDKVTIEKEDNAGTVHDKLMYMGGQLVLKTTKAIEANTINAIPQNSVIGNIELKAAPKIFKDDCKIDWALPRDVIHNKVRGLSPYPAAWTNLVNNEGKAQSLKVFTTCLSDTSSLKVGEIETDGKKYIKVGSINGDMEINNLQLAGKKRMTTEEFLRGFKLDSTYSMSC